MVVNRTLTAINLAIAIKILELNITRTLNE